MGWEEKLKKGYFRSSFSFPNPAYDKMLLIFNLQTVENVTRISRNFVILRYLSLILVNPLIWHSTHTYNVLHRNDSPHYLYFTLNTGKLDSFDGTCLVRTISSQGYQIWYSGLSFLSYDMGSISLDLFNIWKPLWGYICIPFVSSTY